MIIRILVVEDEDAHFAYVSGLMEEWFRRQGQSVSITHCKSAEEYLFKYAEKSLFEMVFLDIALGQMTGMELAKRIRQTDRDVQIIFLTGVQDYVFEGYEIGAVRYLLKPVDGEELGRVLQQCTENIIKKEKEFLIFSYQGEQLRIAYSEIIYIAVEGHYLKIKTKKKLYDWKGTLVQMASALDTKRFVPVGRSCLVNMDYVTRITREICYLESGDTFEISRGAYKALNEAFMAYYL